MYHSVTIGTKNTWADWRLIPASPPMVVPPPVRKKMTELPGGNGSIDLTMFLGGGTHYGLSEGSWEFIITDQSISREEWKSILLDYLHGKRFDKIVLEDDPDWYYSGRIEVGAVKTGKTYSTVTINYSIDPYKKRTVNNVTERKF